jgi:hypothetical protein
MQIRTYLIFLIICLSLIKCERRSMKNCETDLSALKNIPQQAWDDLSTYSIYFGHQSLGFNIIDGINSITQEIPEIKLNIKETRDVKEMRKPIFAHSRVGTNKDPISKINDFKHIIENDIGDSVDFAFFKFCYVDINENTDVEKLFAAYKNTMDALVQKYQRTTFVHFTVPLRIAQTGAIVRIKKLIGRPIGGYTDNIKRNEFNEMLLKEYRDTGLVFDLAKVESTYPDGSRTQFKNDNKLYAYLIPNYTNDGGHLNKTGRGIVAEKFLIFLTNLSL